MAQAGESAFPVTNSRSEKLAATLLDAGSGTDVCILCHGFLSHKDNTRNVVLAPALAARGVSTVRFDFAGNGESEGAFDFGDYGREVEDLRSVVLAVRQQGRSVRAIMGHSKGGNTVLLYAAKYDDVPLVCNVCGRADLTVGVEERFGTEGMETLRREGSLTCGQGERTYVVTHESLQKRLTTDMAASVAAIKESRVFTIHGTEDEIIPVADAYAFDKVIPRHTLQIVEGADHRFHAPAHCEELVHHLVAFICPDGSA